MQIFQAESHKKRKRGRPRGSRTKSKGVPLLSKNNKIKIKIFSSLY